MTRSARLSLPCLLLAAASSLAQENASEEELARLIAVIDEVKDELAETHAERSELQVSVEAAERRIEAVRSEVTVTSAALADIRSRLASLEADAALLEQKRTDQESLIAIYLRQAWRQGEQPRLKLLLNQEDPALTARLMRYHAYLSQAHTTLVREYALDLAQLAELRQEIATQRTTLEERQATLAGQQEQLAGAQQERLLVLAGLDATLSSRGQELERLEMQRVEIEVLLEELRRSVTELTLDGSDEPMESRKGRLPWPVDGSVGQHFGSRHELGDLTAEGMTILAEAGAPVHAVHHGRVIYADWFGNSGLLLILDHGDGYMTLYAHNQELYKAVGEWVAASEVIAATGNTGGQRDTSLYFELRINGRAQDPLPWLLSRD